MKTAYVNAQTGREYPPSLPPSGRLGLCNTISWKRLEQVLRDAGEIRRSELLISYEIGDDGITYRVES